MSITVTRPMKSSANQHDRRARMDELFTAHAADVYAFALRRSSPSTAEDVVSETFLVAWRRLDSVPDTPKPWLLAVARRVLANQRRSNGRQSALRSRLGARDPDRGSARMRSGQVTRPSSLPWPSSRQPTGTRSRSSPGMASLRRKQRSSSAAREPRSMSGSTAPRSDSPWRSASPITQTTNRKLINHDHDRCNAGDSPQRRSNRRHRCPAVEQSEDAQRVLDRIVGQQRRCPPIVPATSDNVDRGDRLSPARWLPLGRGSGFLGEPAPEPIRADLAAVDEVCPKTFGSTPMSRTRWPSRAPPAPCCTQPM